MVPVHVRAGRRHQRTTAADIDARALACSQDVWNLESTPVYGHGLSRSVLLNLLLMLLAGQEHSTCPSQYASFRQGLALLLTTQNILQSASLSGLLYNCRNQHRVAALNLFFAQTVSVKTNP